MIGVILELWQPLFFGCVRDVYHIMYDAVTTLENTISDELVATTGYNASCCALR